MKSDFKVKLLSVLRYLPLALCVACALFYFFRRDSISLEAIVSYAPARPALAALFLIAFYIVKSLAVFFPVILLFFAGGYLFDPLTGIIVNVVGMAGSLLLEYYIGRFSGRTAADRLLTKYPKAAPFISANGGNGFFLSFFLRIINLLPCDLVSMYLGAVNIPLWSFLAGSFAGILPGLIASTLVGTSITDPSSPMFIISAAVVVLLTVGSTVGYYIYVKKKNNAVSGKID